MTARDRMDLAAIELADYLIRENPHDDFAKLEGLDEEYREAALAFRRSLSDRAVARIRARALLRDRERSRAQVETGRANVGTLRATATPTSPGVQCCPRDHNRDGNCDVHGAPGVLRIETKSSFRF